MATLRMASPWRDPRTGIFYLRKRIPARYRPVTGQTGEQFKLSMGTRDPAEARRLWPDFLRQWADKVAEWERLLNVVPMRPERAAELASLWIARVGPSVVGDGYVSDIFEPLYFPEERTPERLATMWDLIERHAKEAAELAGVTVAQDTWPILVQAMAGPVNAAYLQADMCSPPVASRVRAALSPMDGIAATLPPVPGNFAPSRAPTPSVSIRGLLTDWKAVAVVKPRTVEETEYAMEALIAFLGHDDASRLTRADLARWRDAQKAAGLTNNTWNNRLSMLAQPLRFAVTEGKLTADPTLDLRLAKSRVKSPPPYSDGDAALLLKAARNETRPSFRWAHWVMAFTGMRAGEVLQLTGGDVRNDGGIWFILVHEDDEGKSVKTGNRRSVPIHDALIAEGFVSYAQTIAHDGPVFPDKRPDKHGNRGGRAWNVVGKWARKLITDPAKAPDHSWRHRFEDQLRAAEVSEDVRDAIVGHSRPTTGAKYGTRGEALRRLSVAVNSVPSPIPPPGDAPGSP